MTKGESPFQDRSNGRQSALISSKTGRMEPTDVGCYGVSNEAIEGRMLLAFHKGFAIGFEARFIPNSEIGLAPGVRTSSAAATSADSRRGSFGEPIVLARSCGRGRPHSTVTPTSRFRFMRSPACYAEIGGRLQEIEESFRKEEKREKRAFFRTVAADVSPL